MPVTLTLSELAELVAPRAYRSWLTMRKIIAAERPVSAARQRRIDRALEPLVAVHQREIMRRYNIDQGTFLPLQAAPYSFAEILALCATREERDREITRRVMRDACNEALGRHLNEYRRWHDRLHSRIAEKVLSAMRGSDLFVTATYNGRDRRRLEPVELQSAKLDLKRDTLSVGKTVWHMIQIETGEKHASVNAPTPNTYRAEGPTSLRDLQIQFEAELSRRIREKKRGPEGYRDDMLEWAKSELGCTRDEAKILWKNRSAEFPRVGRHKKPRPSRKIGTT